MKINKISIIFLTIIFASCTLQPFEDGNTATEIEETNITEESTLFENSTSNNKFVFMTNDAYYLNDDGYTIWTVSETNKTDSFKPISVQVCKQSGRKEAGFGIVLCEQKIDDKPYMLTVLINTNGLYAIGKVINGVFYHVNDGWKNSNYIYRGYGVTNNINVSYDTINKHFILNINGYEITAFTVAENIVFKNSKSGFVVVIASNENFPNSPVMVTFEK